jgi:hypothetical protein
LHPSGQPVPGRPDEEVPNRPDHQQQAEGVAHESRDADHHSADEDDQSVEQLPGGYLAPRQPLLGVGQDPDADATDYHGPERADDDQDRDRPDEADLFGHHNECSDLCGNN